QLPLDHVLHSGMIQATSNPTKDSKFIYNAIDMTPANMRLLMGEKILEAASILVGAEHRHHVLLNNMNVRIDIPTGKQLIGWHQDYHYLFHDTEPNKTVSAWIPLETCEKENGALEVAVGSHKRGLLKTKSVDKKDSNRDDYLVESDLLAGLTTCQVGVPRGSVLFLHINIAHRSGVNSSQRVRYTTLARYNNAQLMKCLDDYHRPKYPVPK
ncbi:MAG: phytanoyl-CoA dioxygenase family protein, partial [Gammaproteobacteria bacterium]